MYRIQSSKKADELPDDDKTKLIAGNAYADADLNV